MLYCNYTTYLLEKRGEQFSVSFTEDFFSQMEKHGNVVPNVITFSTRLELVSLYVTIYYDCEEQYNSCGFF